jgi:class 3 adenylate cyclase/tetratricopeptide (TPR) repeat protein
MRCASCQRDNPDDAAFCNGCGRPVGSGGKTAPADTPPSLPDGDVGPADERKQVTVLFADVKGSVELAGGLDVEAWRQIMERFFTILGEGVRRYEGTIMQFTGDGVMAVFGAPVAHEDHARRACYAALHLTRTVGEYALELRRTRGLGFWIRMGLNSGEVVVGNIGESYAAVGLTVGLAARMEELAEPGKVYVTESTASQVSGFFRLTDLGTFRIKGVAEPMRVHELVGPGDVRTRLDVSRARGFSRFVGRREEMNALEAALARAEDGDGNVVGVVGEPGVGKSRLCDEFVRRARASGIKVIEAHGVSHGRSTPFVPVLELLRGYFGIGERDGPVAVRQKIAGSLLLLDERFREDLPLVFEFLGVPDPDLPYPAYDAESRQARLLGLVGHLLRARSNRGPALVLVEDLHWLDPGSEAYIEHLARGVPSTRTFLLVNFRSGYHAAWMDEPDYSEIPLGPLAAEAVAELLDDLLGPDPAMSGLAGRIQARTGGNPFFVEEVVRSLVEAGSLVGERGNYRLAERIDESTIPASVESVLAARIDRLAEREKVVLQMASVIGVQFPERVLWRVAAREDAEPAATLRQLVRADFLTEVALYPEAEYAFRHPLTQEVAYRSQLASRRAQIHADVARAIEELYDDRLDEHAALVAHHWAQGGDGLRAARWSRRAADWAGNSDPGAAVRHWRMVREHLAALEPSDEREDLAIASCLGILGVGAHLGLGEDEAHALFREGRELAKRHGEARSLARLLLVFARLRGQAGCVEEAVGYSVEAAALAEGAGWRGLRLAAAVNISHWCWQVARWQEALDAIDRSLADPPGNLRVGAEHLGYSPYIWLSMHRGRLLPWLGRLEEAAEALERAMRLARDHDEMEILCWAHQARVDLAWLTGDGAAAIAHARRAVEIADRVGASILIRWSSAYVLGRAHLLRDEWSEAQEALERSLHLMRKARTGLHVEGLVLAALAEAHLGAGDAAAALPEAERAVEVSRERGLSVSHVRARLVLASVLIELGRRDRAEIILDEAAAELPATGAVVLEPFVQAVRDRLSEKTRGTP